MHMGQSIFKELVFRNNSPKLVEKKKYQLSQNRIFSLMGNLHNKTQKMVLIIFSGLHFRRDQLRYNVRVAVSLFELL